MILNEKDNKKVYEDLKDIIEWIKIIQKDIVDTINIGIDAKKNYIEFCINNEECHVWINKNIYFLTNKRLTSEDKLLKDDSSKRDYIIVFICNWWIIKKQILESIKEQEEVIRRIREFEV